MRKILVALSCAALLASCGQSAEQVEKTNERLDSLQTVINQKDNELNGLMATFNEIQQGFDLINEAEGRVNLYKANAENSAQDLKENMEFIQKTMDENKKKIAELQEKLKKSGINSAKLQEAVNRLSAQMKQKDLEIAELQAQLTMKDERIAELGQTVDDLSAQNDEIRKAKEATDEVASKQDAMLNTAWYVYGTKSELKERKILVDGDVLKDANFDADYFTKIDIRNTTTIPLKSKSAKVLTTHPDDSYKLEKDAKGEYTLRITDVSKFWSVSKYLVIRVK